MCEGCSVYLLYPLAQLEATTIDDHWVVIPASYSHPELYFIHFLLGTEHPGEDNADITCWAEIRRKQIHKQLTYNRYQSH